MSDNISIREVNNIMQANISHQIIDLRGGSQGITGITDVEILSVAKAIGNSTKIMDLGIELGIQQTQIQMYKQTNHSGGKVSSLGTLQMLFEWKEDVSRAEQRTRLRSALENVGLIAIAESFISHEEAAHAELMPSSALDDVSLEETAESTSSEEDASPELMALDDVNLEETADDQLVALARNFPCSSYFTLCNALGCAFSRANNKLVQRCSDYYKALLDVLMEWKIRTGGERSNLITALRKAQTAGLINMIQL